LLHFPTSARHMALTRVFIADQIGYRRNLLP
jgi:hypothetical protein